MFLKNLRPYSLYFLQNKLMLTESRGEFSDLHSIFRLRALRYWPSYHWFVFLFFFKLKLQRLVIIYLVLSVRFCKIITSERGVLSLAASAQQI